jgi:hypothetical protein
LPEDGVEAAERASEQDATQEDVCGNGMCEAGESCATCSDCGCDGAEEPVSTEILAGDPGYVCFAVPQGFRPAYEGFDTEVVMKLGPAEQLALPRL